MLVQSFQNILFSGIDDARSNKNAAFCQIFADILTQTDDNIRNDVSADQLEAAFYLTGKISLMESNSVTDTI